LQPLTNNNVLGILDGRKTLAIVSRELKESGEWKKLTQEEEDELMDDIQLETVSKASVKVHAKDVATEIAKTMGNIDPEVCLFKNSFSYFADTIQIIGLEKRTSCNVFWGLTRNTSNDNFGPRSYASDPVKNACLALFKLTPEQIVVNIDAYIASGVEGVVRTSGARQTTLLKKEIRDMVRTSMGMFFRIILSISCH
jgi:hypothetical protein